MPIYTHECDECGNHDAFLYNMSEMDEKAIIECPKCGKHTFKRVMSVCGFDCVGNGFYCNDYGKKAWKKNLSVTEQARVIAGDREAY